MPGWKNVSEIEPGLWLGNLVAARSTRSLSERGITHILSVCTDPIPAESPESGMTHMRIPVDDVDYADLLIHLPAACRFIHQARQHRGTVLVHCAYGQSQSAVVVAAYLMWSRPEPMNASQALDMVRRRREQIWPNPGFVEQLVLFQLCQYNPTPSNGIYWNWRHQIERRLRAASQASGSGGSHSGPPTGSSS
ncbi:hypothetical protein PLICRDRAFT_96332 [Plicaturopsis crispa FD-325 SS-3]|nr:hypothetical protein PLICRDRAFT_96332 [Plicaturopsis crispa FD-325 SS-3]